MCGQPSGQLLLWFEFCLSVSQQFWAVVQVCHSPHSLLDFYDLLTSMKLKCANSSNVAKLNGPDRVTQS